MEQKARFEAIDLNTAGNLFLGTSLYWRGPRNEEDCQSVMETLGFSNW